MCAGIEWWAEDESRDDATRRSLDDSISRYRSEARVTRRLSTVVPLDSDLRRSRMRVAATPFILNSFATESRTIDARETKVSRNALSPILSVAKVW